MYFTKKIISVVILPVIGIACVAVVFFVFLNGPQRAQIFKDMAASLPVVKNFVKMHYDTRLSIASIEDRNFLKTAFFSVDYLGSVRNGKGERYLAVYPFEVEAGFNLENASVSVSQDNPEGKGKLLVELPEAEIMPADLDEKKGILIVRDDLKADHEYALRPLKAAFEKLAADYALRNQILEKAGKNAEKFYKEFWNGSFDEVIVQVKGESEATNLFADYQLPRLPLKFTVTADRFGYEFCPVATYETSSAIFRNADLEIRTGFVADYQRNFDSLYSEIADKSKASIVTKFIDPNDPSGNGAVCRYGSVGGDCFIMRHGKLFFVSHRTVDAEQAKNSLGDLLYLSFNAWHDSQNEKSEDYFNYLTHVSIAEKDLVQGDFSHLEGTARTLIKLDNGSNVSRCVSAVARTLSKNYDGSSSGSQYLDRLLYLYDIMQKNDLSNLDLSVVDSLEPKLIGTKYKGLYNDLISYLIINQNQLALGDEQIQRYAASLVNRGHLTFELLHEVAEDQRAQLLQTKFENIINKIRFSQDYKGNGMFRCERKQTQGQDNTSCKNFIYYDENSEKEILNKGKETIPSRLKEIFRKREIKESPEEFLVLVISRSKYYVVVEYDALVFKENRIFLIKNIMDDYKDMRFETVFYNQLNPGNDIVELKGDKYNNVFLVSLLNEIRTIYRNPHYNTRNRITDSLRDIIVQETKSLIQRPSITAETESWNSLVGFLDK